MKDLKSKRNYIVSRLSEVEAREPDDISDITLTEYVFLHLESESDYDEFVEFLHKNPNANTIDITVFCIDLDENRH